MTPGPRDSAFDALERGLGIAGKYRLTEVLAAGGMGTVYRALQVSLDRPVALKVLKGAAAWQDQARERFLAEARVAARISHPNVVRVVEPVGGPQGLAIVYELVEGESLRKSMERGLTPESTLRLLGQAAAALAAVHDAGAVHRDVKPENLLVDKDGQLKLTDLGIAKDFTRPVQTRTGLLFGTPAYMSPEQCRGEAVGPSSDLYSLGVVLYEALTGTLPFRADALADLLRAHLEEVPEPPSSRNPALPPEWDGPLTKALAKAPAERYHSALELAAALESMATQTTRQARPAPRRQAPSDTSLGSSPTVRGKSPREAELSTRLSVDGVRSSALGRRLLVPRGALLALLAAGCVILGMGVGQWLSSSRQIDPAVQPSRVRPPVSVAATGPSSAPLQSATSPGRPEFPPPLPSPGGGGSGGGQPLLEGVLQALRAEAVIEGEIEPLAATGAAPAASVFVARLYVIEPSTLAGPKLRLRLPKSAPGPAPQLRAVVETVDPPLELRLTPAEAPSGLAWAAAVPPGILREGANRVRFEASTPRVAAAPECRLTFGRDPAFPRTRNASPQVVCPDCCPPDPEIDKFWDLWFHGKLFSAMQHIEKLRKRWPRCAQALCAEANVCFRIGLEREQIGEMSLAVSMAVLGDGDSHSDVGSSRELWDRGCELLVTATRLYPGWTEPPYRFARAARDWGRLGPALRAARWAVALGADDPVLWTVLADVECALAQSPRSDLSRAERQSLLRTALVHIDHALPLLPRAVAQDEALKIKEAILAGPGSRPEPGKRAK